MIRGCLLLVIGFVLGAGVMMAWWPRPPAGVSPVRSPDLRIFVSDAYLSRAVERQASGMQIPRVDHVHIASHPPTVLVVRCDLSLGPLSAPAVLELAPRILNGQVQTELIATRIGGIPIPQQLTVFVTDAINRRIRRLLRGGGRATGVRVLPSGLEVTASYP